MFLWVSPALSILDISVAKEEGWELSQPLNSSKAALVSGNAHRQRMSLSSIHVLRPGLGFRVWVRVRVTASLGLGI